MTWLPKDARWRKWYRQKLYYVTCDTLGMPATKEGSYRAANEWWESKKVELDANAHPRTHPGIQEELERRRDWARQNDPELAQELTRRIERLGGADDGEAVELALTPDLDERIKEFESLGWVIPPNTSRVFLDGLLGDGRVFKARRDRPSPKIPEDRTVKAQVARYLEIHRAAVRSEGTSVAEYDLASRYLREFEAWLKPETPIDSIDADR
jgi:hypothetical protein